MKILNLYAGIGGNRKLWENVEVTAVENEQYIADAYKHLYPNDTVVVADAHQYLLDHHTEFDFIWSSPPCPTHSRFNTQLYAQGYIRYPDVSLYQEVTFLKHFYKGLWVVENVEPYYKPWIQPSTVFDRHAFWSNFYIPRKMGKGAKIEYAEAPQLAEALGIDIDFMERKYRRKVLRNAVHPNTGLHVFQAVWLQIISESRANVELFSELAKSAPTPGGGDE